MLDKSCTKIDTNNKLPLFKLIYLFFSENNQNLSEFYQDLKKHPDYIQADEGFEKDYFLINQVCLNREQLNQFFIDANTPLNNWLFSNGNAVSKHSRLDKATAYAPTLKTIADTRWEEYESCASFEDLFSLITNGQKLSFTKEI